MSILYLFFKDIRAEDAGAAQRKRTSLHLLSDTFARLEHYQKNCGRAAMEGPRSVTYETAQGFRLLIRFVEAGCFASIAAGRTGRRTSSPPQLGHR